MKTNQIMTRQMGMFSVYQRTKDAMFDGTSLLRQWNESTGSKKEMKDFFRNENTKAFIDALIEEENLNGDKSPYFSGRGRNGGTWMHPILFIKFAMWLNPKFEVKVIKFVHDQMIAYRDEAGNAYKDLAKAIQTIVDDKFMPTAMSQVARGLNFIVFGDHDTMIRNQNGSEDKMRELFRLERKVADLINEGFIKDFKSLMGYLRKTWQRTHTPKVFIDKSE